MSNEVGFSFQADVVNTGSLAHMLTGRVLKALSDGGVDTYAVAAAFWMGAKIPVRSSLADTVHAQISKRPSYQSVLSRALNIGWGHSTPVIEMTRTRAGTNGLLLVGAFATGVPAFQAAQSLSELLSVYDLGADMLPNVDVLKGLVKYLAPFVHDLGFSKVLQHITHVCESAIKIENYSERSVIREIGSPKILAAAVKQLVYTSQLHQDHYMILKVRGSWLPAFASHLLGMSVELRCRDKTIWASGGDNGTISSVSYHCRKST
ncbi:hypothetical protein CkaCkLH20_03640 [Colletotrichum karsti]|uniref:Uncharacterized protein n=1 Tax=Colletotrichum karsti TaxID=1095194 RepID=A0A9P6IH14_9PEZI|nr:uncharacterized protein CkaCkLH20_03640 [Colletotrichum karsti]KAF9878740.1 hypothetical protein CkaCkLH20_03640 [Colletotrichum karsti]